MAYLSKITPLNSSTTYDVKSWAQQPILLSNVDLDNYKTTTLNLAYYGGGSNGCTNHPYQDGVQFGMQTYATAGGHVAQELSSFAGATTTTHGKWIRWHNNTSWSSWEKFVTSSNYTDYTVTKTGNGASGTWGISISGNAATATKATQDASGNVITSTYVKKAGDTMTGTLKLVNDTQNDASDALLYVQHKNNNDWNVIIDSTGYNYGLDVRTAAWANWGIKLNGLIHWDLRDATSAKNTIYNLAYLTFKNSQNSVEYNTPLIRYIGTDATDGYNAGVLYGSTSGTTWLTAGESGSTMPTKLSAYNDEHVYISADGNIRLYSGCANDAASYHLSFEARSNGYCYGNRIYNAVWNDYAEFRITKEEIEPGRCIVETGKGDLILSTERLQEGCEIVSDTYGFAIGENEKCKTPTACAGRVLAYLYEDNSVAKPGRPVCSGPNGTVSLMTNKEAREYPWCIIGTISEIPDYNIWYAGQDKQEEIKVNGRIWIRIR